MQTLINLLLFGVVKVVDVIPYDSAGPLAFPSTLLPLQ